MEDKEYYFQSVARHFFQLRGAPFFLSSKELAVIDNWESRGIPLKIVLEGIKTAYENLRKQPGRKGRKLSLIFCQREVLGAFAQYKDRKVGQKGRIIPSIEKRNKIRAAVNNFLAVMPEAVIYLQEIFRQVEEGLSQGDMHEEELEKLEEYIESLLLRYASHKEIEQAKKDIRDEYVVRDTSEITQLAQVKLIKRLRDKYKVPHISLFYY